MNAFRSALLAAPALLALAACSGGAPADGKREAPAAPLGFELAAAAASALTAPDDAALSHDAPDAGGGKASGMGAGSAAVGGGAAAVPFAVPPMIDLTPEEVAARLAAGNVRLIDVRTPEEVAEGMIPGAEHIPLDRFDPAKLGPPDGREVVLYCRSGKRSAKAGAMLAEVTGAPVEHLAGGILAWEESGQPLDQR